MAEIKASLIKELRTVTGAGMMDCKKALIETEGDFEEAKDFLRKKGLAAAAKKAGRTAAEGLVAVKVNGTEAAVIELNSETDFVSKNENFQAIAADIAEQAIATDGSLEAVKSASYKDGTIDSEVQGLVGSIGENLTLRRTAKLSVDNGIVATYVHNKVAEGLGKIGVLVAIESDADAAKLEQLGTELAMHVAAICPESLNRSDLPQDLVDRERKIFSEQALASGKPESIIEKMVEGRINKYYGEVVFLEQPFVIDGKTKVADVIDAKAKELGAKIEVKSFIRFTLGEGVEKKESDFAAEVAAVANG